MAIDEAIKQEREMATIKRADADWLWTHGRLNADDCISCAEYHEQIAEWLEELKAMKEGGNNKDICHAYYNTGYIQALDDLAKEITEKAYTYNGFIHIRISYLNEIAEQLKEGVTNG